MKSGRGTATFDGLSIAWAVSEHLAGDLRQLAPCSQRITTSSTTWPRSASNVANFQVMVEETGDDLVFLHHVQAGGASRSYGIEAARLAGVPSARGAARPPGAGSTCCLKHQADGKALIRLPISRASSP